MAYNDLDTYDIDLSDDPFDQDPNRASSPPSGPSSRKRKDPDSLLGLDEEVSIAKRARAPAVKLDEARLLSDAGIPRLRRTAGAKLKFKGRGHEFGDAARLLGFYQLWLDDLFPKARFLDALAMVEKVGHKKTMIRARMEWIEEGRRTEAREGVDDDLDPYGMDGGGPLADADGVAGQQQVPVPALAGPATADRSGSGNANEGTTTTPKTANGPATTPPRHSSVPPDDEDLFGVSPYAAAAPSGSIFGNPGATTTIPGHGGRRGAAPPDMGGDEIDDEDLDALMAMEEAERAEQIAALGASRKPHPLGERDDQAAQKPPESLHDYDFADDEAAMAEMADDEAAMAEMDAWWDAW